MPVKMGGLLDPPSIDDGCSRPKPGVAGNCRQKLLRLIRRLRSKNFSSCIFSLMRSFVSNFLCVFFLFVYFFVRLFVVNAYIDEKLSRLRNEWANENEKMHGRKSMDENLHTKKMEDEKLPDEKLFKHVVWQVLGRAPGRPQKYGPVPAPSTGLG